MFRLNTYYVACRYLSRNRPLVDTLCVQAPSACPHRVCSDRVSPLPYQFPRASIYQFTTCIENTHLHNCIPLGHITVYLPLNSLLGVAKLPFQFFNACVLIVMNPPDTIEVAHRPHVFWKFFRFRPFKVVDNWYNIALRLQRCNYLLKNKMPMFIYDVMIRMSVQRLL